MERGSNWLADIENGSGVNEYEPAVRAYLAYCKRAGAELKLQGSALDPEYHPTPAGACKLIHGDAKAIREAFRVITGDGNTKTTSDKEALSA